MDTKRAWIGGTIIVTILVVMIILLIVFAGGKSASIAWTEDKPDGQATKIGSEDHKTLVRIFSYIELEGSDKENKNKYLKLTPESLTMRNSKDSRGDWSVLTLSDPASNVSMWIDHSDSTEFRIRAIELQLKSPIDDKQIGLHCKNVDIDFDKNKYYSCKKPKVYECQSEETKIIAKLHFIEFELELNGKEENIKKGEFSKVEQKCKE